MLLAACTCSLERCLFKSIACFSVGQLNCQRPLLNILDSGHHLHFQKTPLPGCEVGVYISARPRATAPGALLPGLLLWRWCGRGVSVQAVGATSAVSPCNLRAQGYSDTAWAAVAFCCRWGLGASSTRSGWGCRLRGGRCPVWRKGRPSAPWGDLCVGPCGHVSAWISAVRAMLPATLQQDKTLTWHQQGVSAQEALPGLLGQLPGGGADRLCCLSME